MMSGIREVIKAKEKERREKENKRRYRFASQRQMGSRIHSSEDPEMIWKIVLWMIFCLEEQEFTALEIVKMIMDSVYRVTTSFNPSDIDSRNCKDLAALNMSFEAYVADVSSSTRRYMGMMDQLIRIVVASEEDAKDICLKYKAFINHVEAQFKK